MAHPCKKCLVKACCSKACDPWRRYAHNASQLMTGIAIIISGIIVVPILIWLTYIADTTNVEWPQIAITFIWIFSFMGVTIAQAPYNADERVTLFPRVVFAPLVLIWLIIIHTTKGYFRRAGVAQR